MKLLVFSIVLFFNFDAQASLMDTSDVWFKPIDTMNFNLVFRGDFNLFENYQLQVPDDSGKFRMIQIKGKGGYSYHYFQGLEQLLEMEKLDSVLMLSQSKLFRTIKLTFHVQERDSGKNILYFEKVRSTKTYAQFNIRWINSDELHDIMWLDYCVAKHYINRRRYRATCLVL